MNRDREEQYVGVVDSRDMMAGAVSENAESVYTEKGLKAAHSPRQGRRGSAVGEGPRSVGRRKPRPESESSSDDEDPMTAELEKVGRSVSFGMPNLPQLPSFNLFENNTHNLSEFLVDQQLRAIFTKRRDQISEFINDLTSGFSIQSAAERLEAFRNVVQSTVELPVSDVETDGLENEPHGVVSAREKHNPIIDDLIIPQSATDDEQIKRSRNKSLSRYNHLTNLTNEEFRDEKLLRSRIKDIMSLQNVPDVHKNGLIQKLMMRSYYEKVIAESQRPASDLTAKTLESRLHLDDPAGDDGSSNESDVSSNGEDDSDGDDDEVVLTSKDMQPSYHHHSNNAEEAVLGCAHYKRNCKVECAICNRWYPCRFCHDAEITDHHLPREQTRHVLCMYCFTPQLPSQICVNESCGKILSQYYCDKCKLFDNDLNKDIYHCDDCGICRLGQGLNQDFFHCKRCNACISIDLQDHHRCIENSTHSNCTICGEYMFNSIKTVVFMQCGHPIHQSCFDEYTKHSYKCPVCSRSIVNMEAQFRVLDQEISLQPLPEPYGNWKCIVQCNDCKAKSVVGYHILGLKCENCKSYNTSQLKILKNEEDMIQFETNIQDDASGDTAQQVETHAVAIDGQHLTSAKTKDEPNAARKADDENDDDDDYEYEDDDLEAFSNLINNDALKSFERYKEWFLSRMDSYLNQSEKETDDEAEDEDQEKVVSDYEEDDYDDMR